MWTQTFQALSEYILTYVFKTYSLDICILYENVS